MDTDCSKYLENTTALRILREQNKIEYDGLLSCLHTKFENEYLNRLIYMNGEMSKEQKTDFANDAFVNVLKDFKKRASSGSLNIKEPSMEGFFYTALKFQYLKLLRKEILYINRQKDYEDLFGVDASPFQADKKFMQAFSDKLKKAWNLLGEECQKLLWLGDIEELNADEILAIKKSGTRDSVIKQKSACRRRLRELLNK